MAKILEQGVVCDGYDVRCLLADGRRLVFHFVARPADVQANVDALETAALAPPPETEFLIETEDGVYA